MTTEERLNKTAEGVRLLESLRDALKQAHTACDALKHYADDELSFEVWESVVRVSDALWLTRDITNMVYTALSNYKKHDN